MDHGETPVAAQIWPLLQPFLPVGAHREVVGLLGGHGHLERELGVAQHEIRHWPSPAKPESAAHT